MKYLYLFLNIGSIAIPFLYSFHPKLKFYKKWKYLFAAIFLTMLVYIPWDIYFTEQGFWGFNSSYYLSLSFLGLPVEEWLFFICIPYACVFTHYALLFYFPKLKMSDTATTYLTYFFFLLWAAGAIACYDKWYTTVNLAYAAVILCITYIFNPELLKKYYMTFIVMLIPFFIVNGILTGTGIDDQVVWYNNAENLGIRLGTIPIEDTVYAFSLILTNLFLLELFSKRKG